MSPDFYKWWKYKNHWSWSVEEDILEGTDDTEIIVFRLMYKPETESSWLTIRKRVLKKELEFSGEKLRKQLIKQMIDEYVDEFSKKLKLHPDVFYGLYTMGFFEE